MCFAILVYKGKRVKGEQGKGKQGKGEPGGERPEWELGQVRQGRGEGEHEEDGQQRFPLSLHHHQNFYDFFPKAIAPFTETGASASITIVVHLSMLGLP